LSLVSFLHDVNTLVPQINRVAAITPCIIFFIILTVYILLAKVRIIFEIVHIRAQFYTLINR
jgi:hypothetical protein